MQYRGSCHCGRVAYTVEGSVDSALECNCSICSRKGSLLWFAPKSSFALETPDNNASTYLFNKHHIRHRFCPVCGIHPYAEATGPDGTPMAAINLRCLEDFDVHAVPVKQYDGRSR